MGKGNERERNSGGKGARKRNSGGKGAIERERTSVRKEYERVN